MHGSAFWVSDVDRCCPFLSSGTTWTAKRYEYPLFLQTDSHCVNLFYVSYR
eukprot:m.195165 g.195165  ORF g.195165 m.195165 type:complete len:51 (+) comp18676_c0_seq7:2730-2882(+)